MFALGLSLLLSDAADASTATSARRSLDWVQIGFQTHQLNHSILFAPQKTNMEPENHPFEKENPPPNPPFWGPSLALGTVIGVSSHSFTKKTLDKNLEKNKALIKMGPVYRRS